MGKKIGVVTKRCGRGDSDHGRKLLRRKSPMMEETVVTLKFWHGGLFKKDRLGVLNYVGGQIRTFAVDVDELCWFYLEELVMKCGVCRKVDSIYYLVPGQSLQQGLRRVYNDDEVRTMGELVLKKRVVDLYVVHGVDKPEVLEENEAPLPTDNPPIKKNTQRKKLTPKRAPVRKSPRMHGNPNESVSVNTLEGESNASGKDASTSVGKGPQDNQPSQPVPSYLNTKQNPTNQDTPHISTQASEAAYTTENTLSPPNKSPTTFTRTTVPEDYEWIDPRSDSPLNWANLIHGEDISDDDESDPEYVVNAEDGSDEESKGSDYVLDAEDGFDDFGEDELEVEEHFEDDGLEIDGEDTSDEEFAAARERVRGCNKHLFELAQQLQTEAAEGKLPGTTTSKNRSDVGETSKQAVGGVSDYEDFKNAVAKFAILQGRNLSFVVSNKNRGQRISVKCAKSCPFRLYSSWDTRRATFVVKSVVSEHSCTRNMERNKQLKSSWLAEQFLEVFKSRPHWPAKEIIETVRRAYKTVVKKNFAYKVKYYAHKMLHGSMIDHYLKLGSYLEAIKNASLGSTVELVTDPTQSVFPPVFQRLFICFEGVQKGWKEGCRPIICVDACFIKTFLGGQLLSAVGRDGYEQMYPIAWAAVEGENNSSWAWFFGHLQRCLTLGDGTNIVIVSDEHMSIINAVSSILPKAEHMHCARHIFALWHKAFRGDEMKLAFWKIAKAYNMADYNEALTELATTHEAAATAFTAYNPKLFCRAFMKNKTDVITNNIAETFNGYIINARTKHLIHMMEDIRSSLMQRLVVKRQEMEKYTFLICPRIQQKLEKEKEEAAQCYVLPSSPTRFQVNYKLDSLTVDLEARSCTCRKWDMCGIPCAHAVASIYFCRLTVEEFVDDCFKKDVYMKAYSGYIPPIEGERHWPRVNLQIDPPPIKIGPGRPRKNRRKDPFETTKSTGKLSRHGIEMTCTLCNSKGHNKRRCTNKDKVVDAPTEPPPKRGRGRPKASGEPSRIAPDANVRTTTAKPTRVGRGGRVIISGRGRGVGRGNSGGSEGGVFTSGGNVTNMPGTSGGPSPIGESSMSVTNFPHSSQQSSCHM